MLFSVNLATDVHYLQSAEPWFPLLCYYRVFSVSSISLTVVGGPDLSPYVDISTDGAIRPSAVLLYPSYVEEDGPVQSRALGDACGSTVIGGFAPACSLPRERPLMSGRVGTLERQYADSNAVRTVLSRSDTSEQRQRHGQDATEGGPCRNAHLG